MDTTASTAASAYSSISNWLRSFNLCSRSVATTSTPTPPSGTSSQVVDISSTREVQQVARQAATLAAFKPEHDVVATVKAAAEQSDAYLYADLLLVCAKQAEVVALLQILAAGGFVTETVPVRGGGTGYLFEIIPHVWCLATGGADQGPQGFGVWFSHTLATVKPGAALLIGICCGKKYKATDTVKGVKEQGTLIFASSALNISEGKKNATGKEALDLKPQALNVEESTHLSAAALRVKEAGIPVNDSLCVMMSSAMVEEAAGSIFENPSVKARSAIAIDMEAAAFLHASKMWKHVRCVGVIKGVSDFGEPESRKTADTYTPLCLAHCLYAAVILAQRLFVGYTESCRDATRLFHAKHHAKVGKSLVSETTSSLRSKYEHLLDGKPGTVAAGGLFRATDDLTLHPFKVARTLKIDPPKWTTAASVLGVSAAEVEKAKAAASRTVGFSIMEGMASQRVPRRIAGVGPAAVPAVEIDDGEASIDDESSSDGTENRSPVLSACGSGKRVQPTVHSRSTRAKRAST